MKRFLCFTVIFITFTSTPMQSQKVTEEWIRRYNGPANSLDEAKALALDNAGNIYVTGRSAPNNVLTIRYNPDGTEAWVSGINLGGGFANDIVADSFGNVYVVGGGGFITIKYNAATGDTIWTRKHRSGPNTSDEATKIAVDGNGNIYVTGTLIGGGTASDIGTIKYNSNGDSLWVRRFDGVNIGDFPRDLAVDAAGNVYIACRSDSSVSTSTWSFVTIKYNTDGVEKWTRRYAGRSNGANGIMVDNSGNVYVTGHGFFPATAADYITIKYDSLGVEKWVKSYDRGVTNDDAVDIATDGVNAYVTGSSSSRYATIKYAPDGTALWAHHFAASSAIPSAIVVDKSGNAYVTGRAQFAGRNLDYLTVKYNTAGALEWQKEYNGPGSGIDNALDIGVDQFGNVFVTGVSRVATNNDDFATIKYGLPGSSACWEFDSFDNLPAGMSLDGKNGWRTVPGRAPAFVVASPSGGGQVLKMDTGPNQTVIMGKNVNDQIGGTHRIKLNVLIDGNPNPAEPTLAKLEIRTTGNPNWDKKFQLYFGAHMRLNYGPGLQDAREFLAANELIKQKWYEVIAEVDLSTNLVDVFLDGVEKLSDVAAGPGAITDIGISAWDRPGVVYYDNLEFCQATAPPPGSCSATSFFDIDAEGWTVIGDVQNPAYLSAGGNPGGYISATNSGSGQIWYWQAPGKFLGDVACAYGKALNFDLRHVASAQTLDAEDVILEGGGLKLVFDTSYNPNANWTSYSVLLRENAGWRKDNLNGAPPTPAEMQATLAALSKLLIRGEFSAAAGDSGHLDNVVLNGPVRGAGPAVFFSFSVDDDNLGNSHGDGDGLPEPGEKVELALTLQNQGILTATGVTAILSTTDSNITISKNDNSWPDILASVADSSVDHFVFEISPAIAPGKLLFFTMTVSASNGGPWTNTFDLPMASATTAVDEPKRGTPVMRYQLEQNYPNPFSQTPRFAGNPSTIISFALPKAGEVNLVVYNLNGQLVKQLVTGEMNAGHHSIIWDAKDERGQQVASGIYLYVITAGEFTTQRKLVLMK